MADDTALQIYVVDNNGNISEIADKLDDYMQEWTVGPYMAQWRLSVPNVKESGLRAWFNNKMMAEVRARHRGSGRWRGFVTAMRLDYDGMLLVKDIKNITTAVKCSFVTDSTDSVLDAMIDGSNGLYKNKSELRLSYTQDWATNEEGLNKYGRIERLVDLNNKDDLNPWQLYYPEVHGLSPAMLLAQSEIERNSDPFTLQIAPNSDSSKREMQVTAMGATELANYIILGSARLENDGWRGNTQTGLRSVAEDSDYYALRRHQYEGHTVSKEIDRICDVVNYVTDIEGRTPLLYAKDIAMTNTVETYPGVDAPTGAMSRMKELTKIPDQDGNYYRLEVDLDGGVRYGIIDKTPRYYFFRPPKGLRTLGDKVPTWDGKPDIIKIIDPLYGVAPPTTWLGDGSLTLPERSTMRMKQDVVAFVPEEYTEADYRLAKEANKKRLDQKIEERLRG